MRKQTATGFFCVLLLISAMNGGNSQPSFDTSNKWLIDPVIRQLKAFDSSFLELNEFPDSVIQSTPKIHLNSHATRFVKDYMKKNELSLLQVKKRSLPYFTIMDSVFNYYQLPLELKYLAVVESNLKSKAVSRVGAVGTWQLMPATARLFSLKVRGKYDERTHDYKSTVAACRYLKDLYAEFSDWLLVIAAYNCGPGNVYHAIKISGSRNFWVLQNYLPAETKAHVKKFIAIHYYFEQYGSITTLTKSEALTYKKSVTAFINKQKLMLEKDQLINTDVVYKEYAQSEKEISQIANR